MEAYPQTAPQVDQPAPALSWLPTIALVIGTALFFNVLIEVFYFVVSSALVSSDPGINGVLSHTAKAALAIVLQTAFLTALVHANGYRTKEYFGLLLPRKRRYAIMGVAAVIGLVLLRLTLLARTGGPVITPDFLEEYRAAKNAGALPILFFAIVVIFPLAEELIFRGFIFRGLEDSRIGRAGAIVVTALLWTATHTPYVLSYLFWIFIYGLLLGWIRGRTGSILGTSIAHIALNLIVMTEASLIVV